jgi:hypothetical protein
MHNQQLERMKSHINMPKKRKSQTNESLYIDFLIIRNTVLENMCGAYCAVRIISTGLIVVIYGVTSSGSNSITDKG